MGEELIEIGAHVLLFPLYGRFSVRFCWHYSAALRAVSMLYDAEWSTARLWCLCTACICIKYSGYDIDLPARVCCVCCSCVTVAECLWPRAIASARFVCVGVVWVMGLHVVGRSVSERYFRS